MSGKSVSLTSKNESNQHKFYGFNTYFATLFLLNNRKALEMPLNIISCTRSIYREVIPTK